MEDRVLKPSGPRPVKPIWPDIDIPIDLMPVSAHIAADDHERAHQLRPPESVAEHDPTAHGQANQMRCRHVQMIEKGTKILSMVVWADGTRRLAEAPAVVGNDPEGAAKFGNLRAPHPAVQAKPVDEHNGWTGAGALKAE